MSSCRLILCFLLVSNPFFSQEATIEWQKMVGSEEIESYWSSALTSNGLVIAGSSAGNVSGDKTENSYGGKDFWVVKMDFDGNILWDKTLGGESDEGLPNVIRTADDGCIIAGTSTSEISGNNTVGNNGVWMLNLNAGGEILWQNSIEGGGSATLMDMVTTSDNGLVMIALSFNNPEGQDLEILGIADCWVVKLDEFGEVEWQNMLGGDDLDWPRSIVTTNDGGFIFTCSSWPSNSGDITGVNNGGFDFWIVKLDGGGNILWEQLIGGEYADVPYDIVEMNDGSYVVVGSSDSNASGDKSEDSRGGLDYWVMNLDETGSILWEKTIGGDGWDRPNNLNVIGEEIIISGQSDSNASGEKMEDSNGGLDTWVVKLDLFGNIIWQKTIGGEGNEYSVDLHPISINEYLMAGSSNSAATGDITGIPNGGYDYLVMKISIPLSLSENELRNPIVIYPNPLVEQLTIEYDKPIQYELYNMAGQTAITSMQKTIDFTTLPAGMYLLTIYNEKGELISRNKVVKN